LFRKSINSKFAVWLALFSLVILGLAPTISKMRRASNDHCLMSAMLPIAMADKVLSPNDSAVHTLAPSVDNSRNSITPVTSLHLSESSNLAHYSHMQKTNTALDGDFACGYCQLLIHFPFITYCVLLILLQLFRLVRQLTVVFIFNTYLYRSWAHPSVRAPPLHYP
jgi:hypothetical protein